MNWLAEFLTANPDLAALVIAKRARRAVHFALGGNAQRCVFTGKPMHYLAGSDWLPIDTALLLGGDGKYGIPALGVRIATDRTVSLTGYSQRTTRVGLFTPSNKKFSSVYSVPSGSLDGDSLVASGAIWEHRLTIHEDGLREALTLFERPSVQAQAGDWFVIETAVSGVSFPDGWLSEYEAGGYRSRLPWVRDGLGRVAEAKRYARTVGGIQYIYTGVPVSWMASAVYPIVIDPDIEGNTADGWVYSSSADYATAQSTASWYFTNAGMVVGQNNNAGTYSCYRSFLKFDTSSIGSGSTINQVNLKLTVNSDSSNDDFDIQIVKQDWSGQDPIGIANMEAAFDNCLSGTADDNIWRNTSGMSLNTPYTSGNLSTTWPSKTGNTYYSLRSSRDLAGTQPTQNESCNPVDAENATASYRPILVVDYTAAGAGNPWYAYAQM